MCTFYSIKGSLAKDNLEYHTSVLHDEIIFDWSELDLSTRMNLYFSIGMQVP